ncbi:E3 ubiquitin-protein ligase SHPRH-like, partial [Argonauta hians]
RLLVRFATNFSVVFPSKFLSEIFSTSTPGMGKRKQVVPQHRADLSTINLLRPSEPSSISPFENQAAEAATAAAVGISKNKKNRKTVSGNYSFPNEDRENLYNLCRTSCHSLLKLHIFSQLETTLKGMSLFPVGLLKIRVPNTEQNLVARECGFPSTDVIYWYVSDIPGCSMFYFEEPVNPKDRKKGCRIQANFIHVDLDIPEDVVSSLKCNLVLLQCTGVDFEAGIANVTATLKDTALTKLQYPSDPSHIKRTAGPIKNIMKYFYGIHEETYDDTGEAAIKPDIEELFNEVRKIHLRKPPDLNRDLQPRALKPVLRPYQKKSVAWMLKQEVRRDKNVDTLHPLFTEFLTLDNRTLYYNKYGGLLVEKKPLCVVAPPGGILADEMGLGKTVEVLSCLLLNPCPEDLLQQQQQPAHPQEVNSDDDGDDDDDDDEFTFQCICGQWYSTGNEVQCTMCKVWLHAECIDYDDIDCSDDDPFLCPHCQVASDPIPSGATLIVAPMAIRYQWTEEIRKHVDHNTFNVFVYEGVGRQRYVSPRQLASHDIVVTTYETLCRELNYVDLPHVGLSAGKRLRNPKRYMSIPSPMVAVRWWRVCLDEAQMVECTTTKTAEMTARLTSINKWCVTGTPIQKNIDDLHGLLMFLSLDPYCVQLWWRKLLYAPYLQHNIRQPLYDTLATVLWRTAKQHVIEEINLPAQTEKVHWLSFSPVEEHFYRRQYNECVRDAMQQLSKWKNYSVKLNSIDRRILSRLLHPLMKLRQACCHPQAVRGEFHSINKKMMTMEELLQSLIKKGITECEEAHRQAIAARHGLAGIHIINDQVEDAISNYREVLWLIQEHKNIRTDDLQLLHCYHNLGEVLDNKPPGLPSALEDDKLKEKATNIRDRLTEKHQNFVKEAFESWRAVKDKAEGIKRQFVNEEWWVEMLDLIVEQDRDSQLLSKVQQDLTLIDHKGFTISDQIHSIEGLKFIISRRLTSLVSGRTKVLKKLKKLQGWNPTQTDIDETVPCCIRPEKRHQQFKCQMCLLKTDLEEYEMCLFRLKQKDVLDFSLNPEEDGASVLRRRVGSWRDGELEIMLKCIHNYLPFLYTSNPDVYQQAGLHLKLLEVYRKEFPLMSKLVYWLRDQVRVYDEVNMCITRMRLPYPGEKESSYSLNVVQQYQLKDREMQLRYEKISADNDLKKRLGQLFYLQNLAKDANPSEDSPPTQCLICLEILKDKWAVLTCGHFYCLPCVSVIMKHSHRFVKCPTCRHSTHFDDISYVALKKQGLSLDDDDDDDFEDIPIKGSFSTKVTAIVQCLLKIQQKDPLAKSLIFSTWSSVLEIVGQALTENGIQYVNLRSGKQSQTNLFSFKSHPGVTVLLLPVHTGCNGLNLVEAQYVILTEPILNPAQELQAIGRVHRIGQTRPTEVHRFFIKATIEERMRSCMMVPSDTSRCTSSTSSTTTSDRNDTTLTIGDLYQLFRDNSDASSSSSSPSTSTSSTSVPSSSSYPNTATTTITDTDTTTPATTTITDTESNMQHKCAVAALARLQQQQ